MASSTNDPNSDQQRYRDERERVKSADVDERDRAALLAFGDYKDGQGATSTAYNQLLSTRLCAEIAQATDSPALVDSGQGEYELLYGRLKNADVPDRFLTHTGPDGWSEGRLRNFRNDLKQLFLYLGSRHNDAREWTDDDAREWAEDIEVRAPPKPKVDPNDLLRPDELAALWSTIDNIRDRAMFALLYCTWQRNAVCRSFLVGDVELRDGIEGSIKINIDASGRKGASGEKPLSWATGPVGKWLDESHPSRNEPGFKSAPLLCVNNDSGLGDKGDMLADSNSINRRLRTWAKRAGLDKDRWDTQTGRKQRTLRAHLLRYTGAVRAAKSDEYSESTVKQWANWAQSSKQLDRYIQLTDEDVLASWAAAHDINQSVFDSDQPEFGTCGRCGGPIEDWLPTCPACGHDPGDEPPEPSAAVTMSEKELREMVRETVRDVLGVDRNPENIGDAVDVGTETNRLLAGDSTPVDADPKADLLAELGLDVEPDADAETIMEELRDTPLYRTTSGEADG